MPSRALISRERLCTIDARAWNRDTFTVSPDARHVAWVEKRDGGFCVVRDGTQGKKYDVIDPHLVFSPDSARLTYMATLSRKSYVVVDGQEKGPYDIVMSVPIFSSDSKKVLFSTGTSIVDGDQVVSCGGIALVPCPSPDGKRAATVVMRDAQKGVVKHAVAADGTLSDLYDEVPFEHLQFSPDSTRLAYVARQNKDMFVCIDGQCGPNFKRVVSSRFSPDSQHFVYTAVRGITAGKVLLLPRWYVVMDGKAKKLRYTSISGLSFLPDSQGLAYIAELKTLVGRGKRVAIINDLRSKAYDEIRNLVLSPDGSRHAFTAAADGKWVAVVDGDESKPYDAIGSPMFSADGKHVAYVAELEKRSRVVVDGREGESCRGVVQGKLGFDLPGSLHYLALKDEGSDIDRVEETLEA